MALNKVSGAGCQPVMFRALTNHQKVDNFKQQIVKIVKISLNDIPLNLIVLEAYLDFATF
jgi:molybdenum cofactor biosynthesis enzyme MoaA